MRVAAQFLPGMVQTGELKPAPEDPTSSFGPLIEGDRAPDIIGNCSGATRYGEERTRNVQKAYALVRREAVDLGVTKRLIIDNLATVASERIWDEVVWVALYKLGLSVKAAEWTASGAGRYLGYTGVGAFSAQDLRDIYRVMSQTFDQCFDPSRIPPEVEAARRRFAEDLRRKADGPVTEFDLVEREILDLEKGESILENKAQQLQKLECENEELSRQISDARTVLPSASQSERHAVEQRIRELNRRLGTNSRALGCAVSQHRRLARSLQTKKEVAAYAPLMDRLRKRGTKLPPGFPHVSDPPEREDPSCAGLE